LVFPQTFYLKYFKEGSAGLMFDMMYVRTVAERNVCDQIACLDTKLDNRGRSFRSFLIRAPIRSLKRYGKIIN